MWRQASLERAVWGFKAKQLCIEEGSKYQREELKHVSGK